MLTGYTTFYPQQTNMGLKTRALSFVKNELAHYFTSFDQSDASDIQACWIILNLPRKRPIMLINYYREWLSNNMVLQKEKLETLMHYIKAHSNSHDIILVGDINLDSNLWHDRQYTWNSLSEYILSESDQLGLTHYNWGNTFHRFNKGAIKESALDHVFSSIQIIQEPKIQTAISDHCMITFSIGEKPKKEHKRIQFRKHIKDFAAFNRDLALQSWEHLAYTEDPNEMMAMFYDLFYPVFDSHSPIQTKSVKQNPKGLVLSDDLKKLIKNRDKSFRKLKSYTGKERLIKIRQYKCLRNRVTNKVRKEEKDFFSRLIKEQGIHNPWAPINQIMSKQSDKNIVLNIDGNKYTDPSKIANTFNNSFLSKVSNIKKDIPEQEKEDPCERLKNVSKNRSIFCFKTVCEVEVKKAIKKLKLTSSGLDQIPVRILKESADILVVPLTRIINSSILTGKFPDSLKVSKVIPIFKNSGSITDPKSYRPISILNSLSKLIESLLEKQIRKYVERENIMPKHQKGFRNGKDTTSCLLSVIQKLEKAKKKGLFVGSCLIDLSAAFDCVEPDVLCKKLHYYGFDKRSIEWIRSYLTNRRQLVEVSGIKSELLPVLWGVPQGSILGPLLFLLAISDIDLWTPSSSLDSYADDITNTRCAINREELMLSLEQNAREISRFMSSNGLKMNKEKTSLLVIKMKNLKHSDHIMKVGDVSVSAQRSVKLLGITINDTLDWKDHLNTLYSDLNKRIGVLNRVKYKLDTKDLLTLANGLILSKVRYGLACFGHVRLSCRDPLSYMNKLQVLINKTMRICLKVKLSDHVRVEELLTKCGWLSLNQTVIKTVLTHAWKSIKKDYNFDIQNDFISDYNRSTRAASRGDFNPNIQKCSTFVENASKLLNLTVFKDILSQETYRNVTKIINEGSVSFSNLMTVYIRSLSTSVHALI